MKRHYLYLGLASLLAALPAQAQTSIGFESETGYKRIGVYDNWPQSPFRTGALAGNVQVLDNHLNAPDETFNGKAPNATAKILGLQRSRFGSNTFGARIDLNEPFTLSPTTRYVHVLINKPREGRVMLIGLGKRTDRTGQSAETEQFWVLSSKKVTPDKWCDAVFPVKGAEGVEIHSLVVVPDCESPHDLTGDFAAYIDQIELDDSSAERIVYGDYPINYDADSKLDRTDRYTNTVTLNSPSGGAQTLTVGQKTSKLLYTQLLSKSLSAKAGETVKATAGFNTGWMHTYIYVDTGQDGRFSNTLNDDGTPAAGSDLVAYSCYNKKNSKGETANPGTAIAPPAFTLPADLKEGFYRIRFKVDWNNIDPAGSTDSGNPIVGNGGAIIDTRLNVHGDEVTISRVGGLNGDLTDGNGNDLTTVKAPFGKPFTIMAKPAPDFELSHIRVRHGHRLDGDSLIHGTPQYVDEIYPAYTFKKGQLTLPAEVIDGDVILEPYFINPGVKPSPTGEDYPLNFPADLPAKRTDRQLASFTLKATKGGTTAVSIPQAQRTSVYADIRSRQVSVVPGDEIATTVNYTGSGMHAYLYVDLNQDGQFSGALNANGTPTISGELVSYTYYNGLNSLGQKIADSDTKLQSLPAFTIPAVLPEGVYRARLKIDLDNIDPAGQYAQGGTQNQIDDNGGAIVDFLINVHKEKHKLTVHTVNGSVTGTGTTGLPPTVTPFSALGIAPKPFARGFKAQNITIRHGHNLDGEQYVHGNRQWSEYKRAYAASITIPKDSVDGDVVITADFQPDGTQQYELVFSDEFDGANGSMPDAKKWTRCDRQHPTWKRFLSINDAEHKLTGYIEDGEFVARCLPNPFKETDNVDMISGGIQTSGKFSFQYGKIEARLMTNPHTGNFPAFWLMPQSPAEGWPYCGEIDIWEQIDSQDISHHTIHSKWANSKADGPECQGQSNNPAKTKTNTTPVGNYHVFGLERTDKMMTWYVDGKKVFSYAKSTNQNALSLGQWPFDQYFYIILNQSVGNGSWAAPADISHTYETRFDWVRVYKKTDASTGIAAVEDDDRSFDVMVSPSQIRIAAPTRVAVSITDVSGRRVFAQQVRGNVSVRVQKGIYVVNGEKLIVP